MNKELLKEFQLQAGGSHYPSINPQMQEAFARHIIDECIDIIRNAKLRSVYTTHDLDRAMSNIDDCVKAIEERFQHNAIPRKAKPSPIAPIGDPGFNIVDGITLNPRAGFEISLQCPREYRLIIQNCIDNGWLKPVACVVDYEQTMDTLKDLQ